MQQRKLYLDSAHQICQSSQSQSKQTDYSFNLVCIKYEDRHTYEVKYLHRYFICVKYLFLYYVVKFIFIGFKIAPKKKVISFQSSRNPLRLAHKITYDNKNVLFSNQK